MWGLRALAVLDGLAIDQVPAAITIKPSGESAALRALSFQPPLYAWLAALGMRLTADLDPLASVLPSYVAGVLVVVLVYLHGRVWRGGGVGLTAAILVGFNPNLLLRMQEATPTTLAVAGAMGALLCYAWHQRAAEESPRRWPWAGPIFWAVIGGLSLGLSLLALGGFGLIVIPVVLLHQVYLRVGSNAPAVSRSRARFRWLEWMQTSGAIDGLLALAIALLMALPWHIRMVQTHGWEALRGLEFRPWGMTGNESSLLFRLFELAPVTVPLGIYGAARAIRLALIDENEHARNDGWIALGDLAGRGGPGTGVLA